jgi:hypothetical protein
MSNPQARYEAIVAALICEPGVITRSRKRGFAEGALMVNEKLFASLMRSRDGLILKLPAHRVSWLADSGDGERLDFGHGVMKEWISVRPDSVIDWLDLAREAMAFVGSEKKGA